MRSGLLFFTNCVFPFCASYGSFVFRRIFKATISSKGISFGRVCGNQKDFDPKGKGDEASSGKVTKNKRGSRETT